MKWVTPLPPLLFSYMRKTHPGPELQNFFYLFPGGYQV